MMAHGRQRQLKGHGRRGQRGSVAVAAIVALAVGLTVSVGMLLASEGARVSGHHKARTRAARLMAEAGIEYGYWQYCYNRVALPYTGSRTLCGGAFSVTVSDGSTAIQRSIKIVSAGTVGADSASVTRVFLDPFYTVKITGTVFTDPNYGGGAGRSLSASSGTRVPNVRVELYDASGNFSSAVVTDSNGLYTFPSVINGASGTVRVVSGTVRSQRTGATGTQIPVLTFRTNAASAGAAAVTDHVGGEAPSLADAGNGSTTLAALSTSSATAQCIAPVTVGANDLTQVDFGFNFDTIVNCKDSGPGSLRQFLLNANALSNTGLAQAGLTTGVDNAVWMLADGTTRPGLTAGYASQFSGGVASIPLQSPLPTITDPVIVDGTRQPGWSSAPIIELNGTGAGAGASGLSVTAGGSGIKGLIINRFSGVGIALSGIGGNTVTGCYVGVNAAGTAAAANGGAGITLSCSSNTIGGPSSAARNILSGNGGAGISLSGTGATGNALSGCFVGLNAAGTAALANGGGGIALASGPSSNMIGGTAAGAGNAVSGNTGVGISLSGTSTTGNTLAGNYVGLNAAGTAAVANTGVGISLAGTPSNTVGGTAAGTANVVSGNGSHGLSLTGGTTGTQMQGNYIGTNASGSAAAANGGSGISLDSSSSNTIGGAAVGAGNLISGNAGRGVYLNNNASSNTIQANSIGTNAAGGGAIGNGLSGVRADAGSTNNVILSNTIANNGNAGVNLTASGVSTGNQVILNSIYNNTGLGIDLGNDGVTANAGTKSASLPNNGMDAPVITEAILSGTSFTVSGYVGSAPGQTTFANVTVHIYKAAVDPSGYGEGATYLTSVTTDANGRFQYNLTPPAGLAVGNVITATATDGSNNTSEFGSNITVKPPPYIFDYTLCSNTALTDTDSGFVLGAGGVNGDIRANGAFSLTHAGNKVNGDAISTSTINIGTVTGKAVPYAPAISFPALSNSYYQGIATRTYTKDLNLQGAFTFNSPNEVVYVPGNLNMGSAATISGTGTIYVAGTVSIQKDISYANSSSRFAILTPSNVSIPGGVTSIVGLFYADNSGGTATITIDGSVNLPNGSLVADKFVFKNSGTLTMSRDPGVTAAVRLQMHLPGY